MTYAESPASHVIVEFSFDVVQAASRRLRLGRVSELHRLRGGEAGARAGVPGDLRPRDEGRVPRPRIWRSARTATRSARRFRRSRASPGATSARRSQKLMPGRRRRSSSSSTCSRQEYEQGLRHRLPEARPARAVPRRSSTGCCRRSVRSGRCSSRRRRRRPRRCFSRASRTRASGIARRSTPSAAAASICANTNFDTGKPSAHGEYTLADETYAELLDRLTGHRLAGVPEALRAEHRRVLRRRARSDVEQERAQANGQDQARARGSLRHDVHAERDR